MSVIQVIALVEIIVKQFLAINEIIFEVNHDEANFEQIYLNLTNIIIFKKSICSVVPRSNE